MRACACGRVHPARNFITLIYPSPKSITTALFYESSAWSVKRPSDRATEGFKHGYIRRMVDRMIDGVHLASVSRFVYGATKYDRIVKLECRYRESGVSTVVSESYV